MAKFRGVAIFSWDFEGEFTDVTAHDHAQKMFVGLGLTPPGWDDLKLKVRAVRKGKASAVVTKKKGLSRLVLEPFQPEDVLSKIDQEILVSSGDELFRVPMNSPRYKIFLRDNCTCQACGLKGEVFYLETSGDQKNGHFNLYAVENGRHVLMTRDHVLARSKGGDNSAANLQTYCQICNALKGSSPVSNDMVRQARLMLAEGLQNEEDYESLKKKINKFLGNKSITLPQGTKKIKSASIAATVAKQAKHTRQRSLVDLTMFLAGNGNPNSYEIAPTDSPPAGFQPGPSYPAGTVFSISGHNNGASLYVEMLNKNKKKRKYLVLAKYMEPIYEAGPGKVTVPDVSSVPVAARPPGANGDGHSGDAGHSYCPI